MNLILTIPQMPHPIAPSPTCNSSRSGHCRQNPRCPPSLDIAAVIAIQIGHCHPSMLVDRSSWQMLRSHSILGGSRRTGDRRRSAAVIARSGSASRCSPSRFGANSCGKKTQHCRKDTHQQALERNGPLHIRCHTRAFSCIGPHLTRCLNATWMIQPDVGITVL